MFVIIFDLGIQSEGLREIAGEVHKLFILNGRPWSGSCTDEEYIDSRFMFLQFLTNFAVQHWKVTNTLNKYKSHTITSTKISVNCLLKAPVKLFSAAWRFSFHLIVIFVRLQWSYFGWYGITDT